MTTLGASATRQVTYYLVDPQGTPLATMDAAGQVLASNDYSPYGREVMGSSEPIGYTGHVADSEIALVYMQQRYYDPDTAIFLSRDPVGPDANSGAHFNRYNYAYSNPYRYTDPDGRCPMCIGFLIGAGIEIGMQWATTGKVDNWTAVAVSGGVGAITGGVGAIAGRAAISGSITVARAATTTALAGGAANAVGKVVEGEVNNKPASSKEVAISAAAGMVGSGAGSKIALATTAKLESMAAQSTLTGSIGRTTQDAVQQGGKITENAPSLVGKAAELVPDATSNYAEKKANP
ncbi:RHS repeat-associated core domain-containing protein [Luteibacter sp. OK325]|uniref:RHS repeat-associated core domain-containing protein n=1 Tax=Luteibacter sp. OK325 TaxID=2135670 RepID=UPI001304D215|nr:RHS repeat-associated core domain-containing protein [Luteibacter sp. OK325]